MRSTFGACPQTGWCGRWLLAGLLAWLLATRALAADTAMADTVMPRPPELDRDVHFWVRVYTEVDTNSGFLHDQYNLSIVYETLHFVAGSSSRERERVVDEARNRVAAALRRIAGARDTPVSPEDQKIKDLWGVEGSPGRLLEAIDDMRFQLGQSDRFRAGLIRSGAWETHIAETLANLGLPAELAVLPHVESSFDPAAYSKVGAAGLWQFMRSTGRRYMRIDGSVDDRLDPFRATEAAAQLLAYNYRLLGTWPLALTAYNHGAAGVRHAVDTLGTDDIVKIVRHYNSRSFGFASRNFYVSFLAALEVDRNPQKYFGPIQKLREARFQEVAVPGYVSVSALERALKIDRDTLRELNPALLRAVWDGQRRIPRDYHLRLPTGGPQWTTELLSQRLKPGELYAGQPEARRYRVVRGDTIASIADQYGITAERLARANRLRTSAKVRVGRLLTVPEPAAGELVAASAPGTPLAAPATVGTPGAPPPVAMASAPVRPGGPASLVHGDVTDLYVVEGNDSVSAIAGKFGLSEDELLKLNGIRNRDFIFEGQPLVVRSPPTQATAEPAAAPVATRETQAAVPAATHEASAAPAVVQEASATAAVIQEASAAPAATHQASAAPAAMHETPAAPVAIREASATPAAAAVQAVPTAEGPAGTVALAGGGVPEDEAQREVREDAAAVATAHENAQPVSAAQAEAQGPSLGAASDPQQNPDPTDYGIAKDDTIRVAAAETLGHYAEWLAVTPARLRQINRMGSGRLVVIGRKMHLDFNHVSREQFEERRRSYHQNLQASYFAAHRIRGTEVYIARKGDSLWTVTQRFSQLPIWLVQEYNPDVDLSDMRPGTQIVMPRVEVVASGEP